MPWAAYDATGRLRIGYFDRSYDPLNHRYGYTLASERERGTLRFRHREVTTQLSDPTRNDFWFSANVNRDFPEASTFVGDYSGIAARGQHVVTYWTDMRRRVCFAQPTDCGHGEYTYFANMP